MSDQEKVRQHTVPAMYLTAFASRANRSGRLQQYSRETCSAVPVSVSDATVKKHVYTIVDSSRIPRMAVEDWLADLEGKATKPLHNLRSKGFVTDDEKVVMSLFIATQMRRTIAALAHRRSASTEMAKPENVIAFVEQMRESAEKRFSREEVEDYIRAIKTGEKCLEVNQGKDIVDTFGDLERYAAAIYRMAWSVSKAPPEEFFVTSDSPAYVRRRGRPRDPGMVGVERADLEAEVYFPLSPTRFLIASMQPQRHVGKIGRQRLVELNRLTVLMSDRFVFAREARSEIEILLREEHGFRLLLPDLVGAALSRV